jgi:hypothetical protein
MATAAGSSPSAAGRKRRPTGDFRGKYAGEYSLRESFRIKYHIPPFAIGL